MLRWNDLELDPPKARRFDVISAGEAHCSMGRSGFRAGRGAIGTALALRHANLRVGLATALDDDSFGRRLADRLTVRGVDVGGVTFQRPKSGVVFVDSLGHPDEIVPFRDEERRFAVPTTWSATVLVLSGLTPVLSVAGSLCQAARAARRLGTVVVVAVEARAHVWQGRDARAIRMILREADVIRYTARDLDLLKMDAADMRRATRDEAVHVVTTTTGDALASGPFGEIAKRAQNDMPPDKVAHGEDALTAAICVELARAGDPRSDRRVLWQAALARGQALAADDLLGF